METKISQMQIGADKRTKEVNQLKRKLDEAKQIENELNSELNTHTDLICSLNEQKSKYEKKNLLPINVFLPHYIVYQ